MRVAFIGNIYSKCGIATYNEELLKALRPYCNIHFFAEKCDNQQTADYITYCWDRNEFPKYELIDKVDDFGPDIVLFSHEYGIFPKSYFYTSLVSYFKLRKYKVVSILHSVYEGHEDKVITESIAKNLVVHTTKAKDALIKKGISDSCINVIPHGCGFAEGDSVLPKLWNHYGNEHVVLQPGFLFYYKSHLEMLDVVAELKDQYSDILYVILGSENPLCQSEHDALHKDICDKIASLDLTHNVIIDRGFTSKSILLSHIRTAKVVVLPYKPKPEFDVFGSSGMARIVAQTSTPLITSCANLFDGLGKIAIKCDSKDSWVKAISEVFENKYSEEELVKERHNFIQESMWNNISQKLVDVFKEAK